MAKYKHTNHSKSQSRDQSTLRKRGGRKPEDLFDDDDDLGFDTYSVQLARIE